MKNNMGNDNEEFNAFEELNDSAANLSENSSNQDSVFSAEQPDESNMFAGEEMPAPVSAPVKKRKALKIVLPIILVLLIGGLAAAAILLPKTFVKLGDSSVAEGNYDLAEDYYKLCFGTNNSAKRLNAVRAIKLIDSGNVVEGIGDLLESGVAVNINYDLDGGRFLISSRKENVTYKQKSEFADLYKAKKEYYSFEKWDVVRHSYAPEFDDSKFDLSLKAVFSLTEYEISYTGLYSDVIDNPQSYTYETNTITLKKPFRKGYTFISWKGTDINGETVTVVIPQGSSGNRAYIANWKANDYVATLNPDVECEIESPVTVTYDESYAFPKLEKRGYTHAGWTDNNSVYFEGVWKTVQDVTLVPVWDINKYKLTYNLEGGSLESPNPSEYTVISEDIAIIEPLKYGYTFQGWLHSENTTPERNVVIKKDTIGDFEFTAVWRGNPHVLTFDANGGTVNPSAINVVFGNEYSVVTPSRTGHTFQGWFNGNKKYTNGVWNEDNDVKVTASWTANRYRISLNANGGSCSSNSLTPTYGQSYSLPTPTRNGYTFTGWYNGTAKFASSGTWNTASDVTLLAGWQGNPHVVTLDADGGNVSSRTVNVVYGSSFKLPVPTKKGHVFAGWYSGNTKYTDGTWNKDSDVALKASWTPAPYEAKLNANGGRVSSSTVSSKYGSSYRLPDASRNGYTFTGWYSGSSKIQSSGTWTWDSNLNLTAGWQANEYTISFDANYGSVSPSSIRVVYDKSYQLPTPVRRGYDFVGWYSGSTKYTNGIWRNADNITLKANWELKSYIAELDTQGGSLGSSSDTYSCKYGSRYSLPTPTRSGYTFEGWYDDDGDRVDSYGTWEWEYDIELYAEWEANDYTVTLDPNGGDINKRTVYVTYGESYTLPEPEKEGYDFDGWFSGSREFASRGRWSVASNVTLEAQWTEKPFEIELDPDGGRVTRETVPVYFNKTYSLPTPTRTGYTFLGWYYGSQMFANSGRWTLDEDIILVAKWDANEYTLTLVDSVSGYENTYDMVYGDSYSLPELEMEGYDFSGWYNGSQKIAQSGRWTYANNMTFKAKWGEKAYHVELDPDGGRVSRDEVNVYFNKSYSLPTPTNPGYKFLGWYFNGEVFPTSGQYQFKKDITVTARWEGNKSTITLNPNGGQIDEKKLQVVYGEEYELPEPTREGFDFNGWYYGNNKVNLTGIWKYNQSAVTLTARWVASQNRS